jgi:hypothetical protein
MDLGNSAFAPAIICAETDLEIVRKPLRAIPGQTVCESVARSYCVLQRIATLPHPRAVS